MHMTRPVQLAASQAERARGAGVLTSLVAPLLGIVLTKTGSFRRNNSASWLLLLFVIASAGQNLQVAERFKRCIRSRFEMKDWR